MKDNKIIIKKVVKKGHEGGHGGSWKVAYADFVTALMAFFLLLWLLSMVAPEKRARVATYFKHFSLFEKSGTSFMLEKGSEVLEAAGETDKMLPVKSEGGLDMRPEEFKESIKKAVEERLGDIKDQVMVDIFEGGVRIQLVDKEGKPMFDLGSSKPTPIAIRTLELIGDNIKAMPNTVAVEGHTDSLAYRYSNYSNWELSTERALTSRKELEKFGLDPSRLSRVAGYADTLPFITEDSKDPRNRRISIILMFPQQ